MTNNLTLPSVFSDRAVLQHSRDIPVWGHVAPGASVRIFFRDASATTTADAQGKFSATIATGIPGGPFELVVQSGDETFTAHDVLVGEVWLCSGQSNMQWTLADSSDGASDAALAREPRIRLLTIPQVAATDPASDVQAQWQACTPESAARFSGVGYHFGRSLHQSLDIPIGLINSSWGGTTAEAWTPRGALESEPSLAYLAERRTPDQPHVDPGISDSASNWHSADLDTTDWGTMQLPQVWEATGLQIDGAVWFRRWIDLPESMCDKPLVLSLDTIDDTDITFFNGQQVGVTDTSTPSWWSIRRQYSIPPELLKPGRNLIAVRVFDLWGNGGFTGKAQNMFACSDGQDQRIDLAGEWQYKVELALPPRSPANGVLPTMLYNGMIHPLVPFALRGAIWYQGESNVQRAFEYRTLFPAMISAWRQAWGEEFPFLFVLLAGFHSHPLAPDDSTIAELRDAQLSALSLPHIAAASAIDLGDIEDIHPRNKKDVGHRLALAALKTAYGQAIEASGPTFRSLDITGPEARVHFNHAQGLHARGDTIHGFAIAGEDAIFYLAQARIDGETVLLSCPQVPTIRFIRYNWADNPLGNLYNSANLPTLPFRTDNCAYSTAPAAEEYGRLG